MEAKNIEELFKKHLFLAGIDEPALTSSRKNHLQKAYIKVLKQTHSTLLQGYDSEEEIVTPLNKIMIEFLMRITGKIN